jgi:hypothetical protein
LWQRMLIALRYLAVYANDPTLLILIAQAHAYASGPHSSMRSSIKLCSVMEGTATIASRWFLRLTQSAWAIACWLYTPTHTPGA